MKKVGLLILVLTIYTKSYSQQEAQYSMYMFYLNDYLTLGYAYDYTLTKLRNYNSGSHEIMPGFDLNKKQKTFKMFRFF
ncbi:MAG: type IX secretion system membrane protein PorP/SprF [Bacteroidota bacterium]